jgi:two-component system sensor histidine kinase HydH
MDARLILRTATPVVLVSLVPLSIGAITSWHVHRSQKSASESLALNVVSLRAAEEVAIGIRDVRRHLERYLVAGDKYHLQAIPELRLQTDHWLAEAERAAVMHRELELIARVREAYERFFAEFERVAGQPPTDALVTKVRELIDDPLTREILEPAQEYLDFNEEEIARSSEENERLADRMALCLLVLGICGPVSGLLAGFGITRAVHRSIVRLSVPIRDAAGKLNDVVGPITFSASWGLDHLESNLQRVAQHLGVVVERLQRSQRETLRAEQLAAVGQMAAGVAHELRNPLMSMKLLIQSAVDEGPAALGRRDLQVLEEETTRLERLTSLFLEFARPPQPRKETFDAREAVKHVRDLVDARASQHGVDVRCYLPKQPLHVEADLAQFRQVLLNLISNALDVLPRGGKVRVRLTEARPRKPERATSRLRIQVADNGPGLPAELGDQIFEPFISTKTTGMGLGLSICRRIVEAHGGRIGAVNRLGGGALLTVELPSQHSEDTKGRILAAAA